MFFGSGAIAQQLRHGAIQAAQRIGIIPLALRLDLRVLGVPARPAAKIAGVIERENGGLLERRGEKRRCGVGLVMLHHGDLRLGELIAQDAVHLRLRRARERAHHGHAFHLLASGSRQAQALRDRRLRQPAGPPHVIELVLLDGGLQLAVLQHGARRVAQQTTQSQNHHWSLRFRLDFGPRVAQGDGAVEHQLLAGLSGALSGSTAK